MTTPQVIVSLGPSGSLNVELPGTMGSRRKIELKSGKELETIYAILEGQAAERREIGLDGAPTAAQVRHWERHDIWPEDGCRFCIAEGRFVSNGRAKRHTVVMKRSDGVEVRRVAAGVSGLPKRQKAKIKVAGIARKSATELGL